MSFILRFEPLASVLVLLAFAVGCASSDPAMDRKMRTVDGIQEVRDEIGKGIQQLDKTVASLDDLVKKPQPDLRRQFKAYTDNLKRLEQSQEAVRKRAASMRARAEDYFRQWEKDMAQTGRAPLQAVAAERRIAARKSIDEISAELARAKVSIAPLAEELADIRVYLSNDLTMQGVEAVRPIAAEVPGSADTVRQSLGKVLETLGRVQNEMSPQPGK